MDGENHPTKKALVEARERVVARLTEGFARDEIGIDAFEQRINDAYQAPTVEQLEMLVSGLGLTDAEPVALPAAQPVVAVAEVVPSSASALATRHAPRTLARAILGSAERSGHITLDGDARASSVLGSLVLDFRDVVLTPGVTQVHLRCVLGSIEVIVPSDVAVECEGSGVLGSFEGASRRVEGLGPNAPCLRIVGSAVLGSIEVRSRPPARIQARVEEIRGHKLLPRR